MAHRCIKVFELNLNYNEIFARNKTFASKMKYLKVRDIICVEMQQINDYQ